MSNNKVKSQQTATLTLVLALTIIVLIGVYVLLLNHHAKTNKKEKTTFESTLPDKKEESFVFEKTQKALQEAQKKTDKLNQTMQHVIEQNQGQVSINQSSKQINALIEKVNVLENKLSEVQSRAPKPRQINDESVINISSTIEEDTLNLTKNAAFDKKSPLKNPGTYVPAGTFVKAVMLGGADASAAVNAQANPVPMLFRIIEQGTLPNHQKSHLKNCVVTAAVVGDISSERGMVRLENLSCTFPDLSIVDQAVEGTVFGTEGKNGVRGVPLWRESALLERAFVAGALSGISDGISQTYTTNSISPEGNVSTIDSSKVFQVGAANGASKAMDKLAEYNIKRAEQYHPVIQLSAGTVVDIVFLKGFYLDGKEPSDKNDTNSPSSHSITDSQEIQKLLKNKWKKSPSSAPINNPLPTVNQPTSFPGNAL